ncbi:MAG: hypothetical protein COT74_08710 [Bdellovibrionales bacterium CG10_big_fil_rev_8_21_14_0_10_45_34]|nr:MAG: hypothetical protein COT74_08710 [Bdellovibrionales bacterium CG10_big_fil_rev_8_21_14_0_10_45_34]
MLTGEPRRLPRVGIVGVGYLGRFHALKHMKLGTLACVYDANREQANKVAEETGVSVSASLEHLLSNVDAVVCASTTTTHFDVAKQALERKLPLFIEKPMTSDVTTARQLEEFSRSAGLLVQVGHIERFNPAYQWIKENCRECSLLRFKRWAPFRERGADVNVVRDVMIHDIDLALDFFGEEPTRIVATGAKGPSGDWDLVEAEFFFSKNARVMISANRMAAKIERSVEAYQGGRWWHVDLGSLSVSRFEKIGAEVKTTEMLLEKRDALEAEAADFVESVVSRRTPSVTARDGLNALIYASKIESALAGAD